MIRTKTGTLIAAAIALALTAAGCGGGARAKTAAKAQAITTSLMEMMIHPSGVVAPARPVRLDVRNDGKIAHQLAVKVGEQVFTSPILAANGTSQLTLPALAAGTYKMWCTIGNHEQAGMVSRLVVSAPGGAAPVSQSMSPQEMEALDEAGVKAFPAKTNGAGGRVLAPVIRGGEKVFELTAAPVRWEVSPGEFVDGMAYNGQIPGPEIRVRTGDRVAVVVRNALKESTTVHFHGVTVPNGMDGVPFITQPPIRPGETFTYRFPIVDGPGTYMYHSHENAVAQVGKGLLGSLVIEDSKPRWDVDTTMVLGDGELGFTLNGKGFPATAPIVAKRNQRVLVRFMNQGQQLHPMHLHGFHFRVIAQDGRPVASPYDVDTLVVAPGERFDVLFTASLPGVWAFHCHILSHAESDRGMFGMVTAVIVS